MIADPQSRIAKIRTHMTRKEDYQAICDLRQLVAENPDLGSGWGAVAELCHALEDMDAGLNAARHFVDHNPDDPERQGMLSEFLVATGRIEEALTLMIPFGEKFSEHPPVHYGIGVMLSRLGRFREAEERFSRTLDLQVSFTLAWEQLAQVHSFSAGDPWIARYQEVEKLQHLIPEPDKPPFFYSLGKLYDDLGDHDRAFDCFSRAAKIKNAENPFNRDVFLAHADRLESLYTTDYFSQQQDKRNPADQPIFIVGVPRSGTTLVERIISAHSDVTPGGEMPLFRLAALPLDISKDDMMASGASWSSIGADYLDRLGERFGSSGRITDKSLANYLFIPAIMLALPGAKIIYCRRDPVDTAWSNFRTLFGTANLMSYNLDDIALYQATYHRLMRQWQSLRPGAVMNVCYEELVADPESVTRQILDYCDLDFEQDCLRSHENGAAVSTASFRQVRQPVYRSAVGGSKAYARHLEPWVEKLRAG